MVEQYDAIDRIAHWGVKLKHEGSIVTNAADTNDMKRLNPAPQYRVLKVPIDGVYS